MFNKLIVAIFLLALPVLAQQEEHTEEEHTFQPLTNAQVWGFGFLAGFGISSIGFLAAIILIIAKKCCSIPCFEIILRFMFSLSCGALVGDAIIHILAQAYQNQQTNKLIVSLIFILSILFFLIVDRLLHSFGFAHSHWVGEKCQGENQNHGHHHHELSDHNHNHLHVEQEDVDSDKKKNPEKNTKNNQVKNSGSNVMLNSHVNPEQNIPQINLANKSQQTQVKSKNCCQNLKGKGAAGYMNIFGSAIHNFFDGLALGIAFATANPTQIIPVVVAIIAHEIPRELGDVAILLKSQFTEMQTVCCNGFVNFLSLLGVFIGLAIVQMHQLVKLYILVFVAGNFIYIAADIWQHIFKNKGQGSKLKNALQVFGLGVGIGVMFLLTLLQSAEGHNH